MEQIMHKNQPYQDVISEITVNDRQDPGFAQAENSIEELYRELGATVVSGLSYSGEQPQIKLFIHAQQSEAAAAFANRPA